MLRAIGYDPSAAKTRIPITTGSGQESAPKIVIDRIDALTLIVLAFTIHSSKFDLLISLTKPSGTGIAVTLRRTDRNIISHQGYSDD